MKIRATLRRPDGDRDNLIMTVDTGATIAQIAAAIVERDPRGDYQRLGYEPGTTTLEVKPFDSSTFVPLDPEATADDLALAPGVTVQVITWDEVPQPQIAILHVLDGPESGAAFAVHRGSTVLGRGDDCDIVLADHKVSKRHARIIATDARMDIVDLNSANGILVQGEPVPRLELKDGVQFQLGASLLMLTVLETSQPDRPRVSELLFTRTPRVEGRFPVLELEGADLPQPSDPQPFPWLAMAAPLILGGVLFAITQQLFTILFIALSPFLMIGTWLTTRSTTARKLREQRARFTEQMGRLETRIGRERVRELDVRAAETPELHEIYVSAMEAGPALWTRRPEHWSFGSIRLGSGDLASRVRVKEPANRDRAFPESVAEFDDLVESHRSIGPVPVVERLDACGALGVTGSAVPHLLRGIVGQLAGTHAPSELVIASMVDGRWAEELADLVWLPHSWEAERVLGVPALADSASAGLRVVAALEELLDARSNGAGGHRLGVLKEAAAASARGALVGEDDQLATGTPSPLPIVVVIVSDDAPVDRARLIQIAERGAGLGVFPIWLADSPARIPAACRTFVSVDDVTHACVNFVRTGEVVEPAVIDGLDAEQFAALCRSLARFRDDGVVERDASDIPRSVSLVEILGSDFITSSAAIVDRWGQNGTIFGREGAQSGAGKLRALVGQGPSDAMHLDLRAQGPHALVGGTTGSGKSEFLQAWVLGMAAEYSPQRVTFLFVDYKGGSAFADCTELPHFVGMVTDLSPHLVRRALISLRAELHYRESLFNRKKAKDILELEKRGDPDTPPALVIVIDEFAALVNEVPEFVDGVVDVAQRGRSLGIHLIMATQRPAGVIKDNLRANTNLRVALRMADEADSVDVVGLKDAALLDSSLPGRAMAKTGPGRVSLFQSAYTGGWSQRTQREPSIDIDSLAFGLPSRWPIPEHLQTAEVDEDDLGPNDQKLLVGCMSDAAAALSMGAPRRPWLDELAPIYDLTELRQRTDSELVLGVIDLPERQSQVPVYFRPDVEGNLAVFGTGGSGKSALLRTLAVSAGITPKGGPVHVYGLDFGAGGLRMLEPLPHVGAVISGDDTERVMRLLTMLRAELDRRSQEYSAVDASTITEYRSLAGKPDEPRIVILVDGFPTFRNEYEGVPGRADAYQALQQLIAEGRSSGIHVALSADRGQSVPSVINAMIQRRVVLRMSDSDAYAMLDVPRDILTADSPPGRSAIDRAEAQIAVIGGSREARQQAAAIVDLAESIRKSGASIAPSVKSLPVEVFSDELPSVLNDRRVIGVAESDLEPFGIEPSGVLILAGPPLSGRSTALRTLATAAISARKAPVSVYLGNQRSALLSTVQWTHVATDANAALSILSEVTSSDKIEASDLVLVIEGIADYANSLAESQIGELVRRAKRGEGVVIVDGDVSEFTSSFGLMGEIKAARRGLVLQPETHDGDAILKTPFPRISRGEFPPGRGYVVDGGRLHKVQVARYRD